MLKSSLVVDDVTVMVPVGVVQVGSVALSVADGAPGALPILCVNVASQPALFFTLMVWGPLARPVNPAEG